MYVARATSSRLARLQYLTYTRFYGVIGYHSGL